MHIKPSSLLILAVIQITLLLTSEAKPTFSWLNKGANWQLHKLHKLRIHSKPQEHNKQHAVEDHSVEPTPSVSYQKSSLLKNQGVTPSVENEKRTRNFFGVNHEHETFKPSKYEKNCFFSPVNCVVYRSKIDGVKVILRRAES